MPWFSERIDELEDLRVEIHAVGGSSALLNQLYGDLAARLGGDRASAMWWAVFGAEDASDT